MAITKCWIIILLCFSTSSALDSSGFTIRTLRIICSRGLPLVHPRLESLCCELQTQIFRGYWYYGGYYLSRHMELLKTWRCPQLLEECKTRPYAYTEFTKLTYDRYCNRTSLEENCISTLQEVISSNISKDENNSESGRKDSVELLESGDGSIEDTASSSWDQLIDKLDVGSLDIETLTKPCMQVAQMDTPNGGFGDYNEIISPNLPFCSMVWCGYSRPVVEREGGIRIFDCLPGVCKANVVIMMIVVILLAIAIVLANLVVIIVFTTSKKLQNSQAMYKVSLAVADLLIGVFVLPTFAVNLSKITLQRAPMGDMYQLKLGNLSDPFVDWKQVPMQGRDGYTVRKTTGYFIQVFEDKYTYPVGCVTSISLLVSIYTLMLAGFDRLLAVHKPLRYRRHPAKKIALRLCLAMWVIAIIFSLLPVMTSLRYGLVSTMLVAIFGPSAHILYIVVFLVPLVMVWGTNIFVYITVRSQARKRMEIATHSVNRASENETESRLTVTLAIIVGVFTLGAVPTIITSIAPLVATLKLDPSNTDEFDQTGDAVLNSADFVAAVILMCNSLWNCFIYSARNRDFKKGVKDLQRKIRKAFRLARERRASEKMRKSRGSRQRTQTSSTTNTTRSKGNTTPQNQTKMTVLERTPNSQNANGNSNRNAYLGDSNRQSSSINGNDAGSIHPVTKRIHSNGKKNRKRRQLLPGYHCPSKQCSKPRR